MKSKINFKIMPKKPLRLLVLFAVLLGIYGWDCWHRRWSPSITQETEHYIVYSTASPEQTQKISEVVETLYGAYHDFFGDSFEAGSGHPKLKLKLFADRDEFRRCNRVRGWAEALYRKPYCYAYYSASELNPYHWMLHEAVHQLNKEVSQLKSPKWIDEGIAEFFGTSSIVGKLMRPGTINRQTYPIWHLDSMSLSGDLAQDKSAGQIIPLKVIITGKNGPKMNEYFNLCYIHWWSLSHFLFKYENGKYREGYLEVIRQGGGLDDFEEHIGAIDKIEKQWYQYLRQQRLKLYPLLETGR